MRGPPEAPSLIIEKRKWDGSVSARWTATAVRDGDRLVWTTPAGTTRERPRRGGIDVTRRREVSATLGTGWIVTAVLDGDGTPIRYEVDATVGDEREAAGVLVFIDLDLDLVIDATGTVLKDVSDFVRRQVEMSYPPDLLRRAVTALEEARALHVAGLWPFDGSLTGEPPPPPRSDGGAAGGGGSPGRRDG